MKIVVFKSRRGGFCWQLVDGKGDVVRNGVERTEDMARRAAERSRAVKPAAAAK